jgi:hypothetical protein
VDLWRQAGVTVGWVRSVSITPVRLNPRNILLSAAALAVVATFGGAAAWAVQEFVAPSGEPATVMAALEDQQSSGQSGSAPANPEEGNVGDWGATTQPSVTEFDYVTDAATKPFGSEIPAAIESGSPLDHSSLDDYGLPLHNAEADPPIWQPEPRSCEGLERGVVVDRETQRGWFCVEGSPETHFVLTSSDLQPDPGDYLVYAKDLKAWSWEFGPPSTMTHFVAFTRGKFKGARVAFHSVPKYSDGSWAQPLESVGTLERFGDSSGCIRLLPEDAVAVWDFLDIGGTVRVIS